MAADEVQRLDLKDLDAVLERAKAEGWTELALIIRDGSLTLRAQEKELIDSGWPAGRFFIIDGNSITLDEMCLDSQPLPPSKGKFEAFIFIDRRICKLFNNFSSLHSLMLRNFAFGNEIVEFVNNIKSVKSLYLMNCQIRNSEAITIASLPDIAALNLAENGISGEGASAISKIVGLTSLDLTSNELDGSGAEAIARLSQLRSLALGDNDIGDAGVKAIARLSNLTSLDLWGNRVGDRGAEGIAKLDGLTRLGLSYNQIGDTGAKVIAQLSGLTSLNLGGNQIEETGARAILDAWVDPTTAHRRRFLDLRKNGDLSGLRPAEVLEQTDAQVTIEAWRQRQELEGGKAPLPMPDAAGESVAHGVQVGTAPDGRLTLVDPALGSGARDDAIGRELHGEVVLALDRLIVATGQSNVVAEWRDVAKAAKARLGGRPREVRVSAILRIERLRSLREADERRRTEPDPLVGPAEAGVAAALRDAVAAANLYVETDPYLAEQQRRLADPGLDLAISTEEAESAEAAMDELDIADPALLAELRLGRETTASGGRAGERVQAWLAGSWRNVVREMLRQVLAWVREQVKAARASAGEATMQAKLGAVITIDEAATWLASIEPRAKNARAAAASAGAKGLRTAGHAFATQVGKRAGDITVMGMTAFLTYQFALLSRLGWPADLRALLARLLAL